MILGGCIAAGRSVGSEGVTSAHSVDGLGLCVRVTPSLLGSSEKGRSRHEAARPRIIITSGTCGVRVCGAYGSTPRKHRSVTGNKMLSVSSRSERSMARKMECEATRLIIVALAAISGE